MNQKIENIIKLIQSNKNITDEEKDNAVKALHDVNKELEITAFKLDRTEKVKKTTSILLEETIEELEQKRKAVEAQNRELEIEKSLEKVRAIAMAMRKPDDMLEVCKTISLQLEFLGVAEIRNVQTAIFYQQNGTYTNYEYYAKHDKTFITETTYTNNELHQEFAGKMLKGKGEIFITHIKGKEVIDWIAYQKTTNVFIDKYLENASSLNYYWFSLGPVALGISTYEPLTEEEINLFKRFLKVFELAYQRYLDIEKAESQAREAQIEAALERVRSRSMAMRSSSEIGKLIYHLYGELSRLDAKLDRCFIMIVNTENRGITWWLAGKEGLLNENGFFVQYNQHPSHQMYLRRWELCIQKWEYLFEGKEKEEWDQFGFSQTELKNLPEPVKKDMAGVNKIYLSGSSDVFGCLVTGSFERLSDEYQNIISRFANVFNQTFTRFLDLQKAEAQAREAEIQLALERVRARSLAMHNTSELQDVVNLLAQQLYSMNLDINGGVWIAINDEVDNGIELWASGGMAEYIQKVNVPFLDSPIFIELRDAIKRKNNFFTEERSDEEKIILFKHLFNFPPWHNLPAQKKEELLSRKGGYTRSVAISNFTSISITNHNGKKFSDDDNEILKRFGNVFEQSYIRFLDLQKAEAQAREAQIELSLERIRAQVTAMKESSDLLDIVVTMRNEFVALGHEAHYFWHMRYLPEKYEKAMTSGDGTRIGMVMELPRHIHGEIKLLADWEKSDEPAVVYAMDVDAALEYVDKMINLGDFKLVDPNAPTHDDIRHIGGLTFVMARTTHGEIGYSLPGIVANPPHEDLNTLVRFSGVFDLAYRRFEDLQASESQNRIIQAENERKSKELEDARKLQFAMLPKELPKLSKLDIAVHMQTATEVGGDYYDFSTKDNGSLNICIGDATGHGLKAGTIVSMIKSLFIADSARLDIKNFFTSSNETLKKMSLDKMMIAFAMINIYGRQIKIANAGIPPVFIFRKESNCVEEVTLHGLPIGAMRNTDYKVYSTELNEGDTILLFSDGLPELQNREKEMYGYERLKKIFTINGNKNSDEIISVLSNECINWKGDGEQNDDITFIVIKIK